MVANDPEILTGEVESVNKQSVRFKDRAHDCDRKRYRKMRADEAITMSKTREWRQAKLGLEVEMKDILSSRIGRKTVWRAPQQLRVQRDRHVRLTSHLLDRVGDVVEIDGQVLQGLGEIEGEEVRTRDRAAQAPRAPYNPRATRKPRATRATTTRSALPE
jgi:hypothetical protein